MTHNTLEIIGVVLLILVVLIPGILNSIRKLWYLKINAGHSAGSSIRGGMIFDRKTGNVEADQMPLH